MTHFRNLTLSDLQAEEINRSFEARLVGLKPPSQAVARRLREEGKDAIAALAALEKEAFDEGVALAREAPAATPAPVGPQLLTAEDRAALAAHGFTPAEIESAEQEARNSRRIS